NNIRMTHRGRAMLVLRQKTGATRPITVQENTFAFAYDETDPPMGKGGEKGVAIRVAGPAVIENNVFTLCGNAAINVFSKPEEVTLNRNVFARSLRANVVAHVAGREMLSR